MIQVTKFVHSCLLVETSEGVALFDPGVMSEQALDIDRLTRLDDIFITHGHGDHFNLPLIKKLVAKFPNVRITSTAEVVSELEQAGITASNQLPEGTSFFEAPHENVEPLSPLPQAVGIHYMGVLTHPGDSHSFDETKDILALPVTAPWGSTVRAVNLALELRPRYVLPIHDWHWSDVAREQMYDGLERVFADEGITFFKLETAQPVEVNLE